MRAFILKDRSPLVLPQLLRDVDDTDPSDDYRLRAALLELNKLSLIYYHESSKGYSMHPLVHTWVRERPETSAKEQAVWCQAAITTLSQSILLPPLGTAETDQDFHRSLFPHVHHVQKCQKEIQDRTLETQKTRSRWKPWPVSGQTMTDRSARQMAKFCLVYAQCGRWPDAERLLLAAKNFVYGFVGARHPSTMRMMTALSGIYWHLGRANDAAILQEELLESHIVCFGEHHEKTLKLMDMLGESRWQQGRYTEALKLHQTAADRMTDVLGPEHESTLKAMDNLGRIHEKYFRFEEAKQYHTKAIIGMEKTLGETHLDTLAAMDNLAMASLAMGGEHLEKAHQLLLAVHERREKKLGKQHPLTLWALANLARVKSALGENEEAEAMIRFGLEIAEQNLGVLHIGPLYGKLYLGQVLCRQQRYQEAEDNWNLIIKQYQKLGSSQNGEHPDRLMAMYLLADCYQQQGKLEAAITKVDEAIKGLDSIGGHNHPFRQQLVQTRIKYWNMNSTKDAAAVSGDTGLCNDNQALSPSSLPTDSPQLPRLARSTSTW